MVSPFHPVPPDRVLSRRLRRGGLRTLLGRCAGILVVMAVHLILARSMQPDQFAIYVVASGLAIGFSMLAMFGFNTLLCRYVSESVGIGDGARARSALLISIRACIVAAATAAILAWQAIGWLGDDVFGMPELRSCTGTIVCWIVLLAASQLTAELMRGLHSLGAASIFGGATGGLLSNAIFLAAIAAVARRGPVTFATATALVLPSLLLTTFLGMLMLSVRWPRLCA